MKTIEDNKFIAVFMKDVNKLCHDNITASPYNYHSSWDCLMPVVEKIYNLVIYYRYVKETSGQFENSIELTTNINSVYESVCKFIEWYNENK